LGPGMVLAVGLAPVNGKVPATATRLGGDVYMMYRNQPRL
jgi:hypothetical protein